MNQQEIFKTNIFITVIVPIIVFLVMLIIFIMVDDIPLWVFSFLFIPVIMIVAGQKTKLIIEEDILRYQQVFSSEEVSLQKVSQIVTREVETIERDSENNEQRRINKIVYVLDESGRTFFSFPANLIGIRDRVRFENAIITVNPNIIII